MTPPRPPRSPSGESGDSSSAASEEATLATLANIVREHAVVRSLEENGVRLASGARSSVYFDMRRVLMRPQGILAAGDALMFALARHAPEATLIGGLAVGAVPLTAAALAAAPRHGRLDLNGFFARAQAKQHGVSAGETLEGAPLERFRSARVAALDDVATSGSSILKAIHALQRAGAEVIAAFALVDRQEGAAENLAKEGIPFHAVLHASNLLSADDAQSKRKA